MSAPLEVVLVSPPAGTYRMSVIVARFIGNQLGVITTGVWLMLGLPLAHSVLGTPPLHPGFWRCALFALLLRATFTGITYHGPFPSREVKK